MDKNSETQAPGNGFDINELKDSRYFRDGTVKPQFRTRLEEIKYCQREFGYGFDPISQTMKPKREFRCWCTDPFDKDGNPQPVCESCSLYRKRKRASEFCERVERAMDNSVTSFYTYITKDTKDMARVQKAMKRNGISYLSVPIGYNTEQRLVISDGKFNGAEITPEREIKRELIRLAAVVSGKSSGNLGKAEVMRKDRDFEVPNVFFEFNKKLIDKKKLSEIEAKSIFSTSNMPVDTGDDVLALIKLRHSITISLLKRIDPRAIMINLSPVMVNFDELKTSIYRRTVNEEGAKRMLDPDTKEAMDRAQESVFNLSDAESSSVPDDADTVIDYDDREFQDDSDLPDEEQFALMGIRF